MALRWMAPLVLLACQPVDLNQDYADLLVSQPTYTDDIAPLLDRYCVSCHERNGTMYAGVELDRYETALSIRVKNTCTAVGPDVIDHFADVLLPSAGTGSAPACGTWEIYSMPPGAKERLSLAEQVTLARWVELGGPR